jgi:hypothetical protein
MAERVKEPNYPWLEPSHSLFRLSLLRLGL